MISDSDLLNGSKNIIVHSPSWIVICKTYFKVTHKMKEIIRYSIYIIFDNQTKKQNLPYNYYFFNFFFFSKFNRNSEKCMNGKFIRFGTRFKYFLIFVFLLNWCINLAKKIKCLKIMEYI